MKKIENFSEVAGKASELIKKVLPEQSATHVKDADSLINELHSEATVKVPFVGDFSAGKSSLLNAMLNREVLPTNISPETAVSYELIFSPNEHLEIYKNGVKMDEKPVESIKELNVKPGDVVKVFLNDKLLKDLGDRGLTLVDMPGIDSGIEAHNAAIASYLSPGTRYMVFSDAEQGTIRNSALAFIKELSKYDDIDFATFLSKIDKKTAEDVAEIQKIASETISKNYPGHTVGKTSAVDKTYDDVLTVLNNIDAESILSRKFKGSVELLIDQMLQTLQRNIQLLTSNIIDADKAIKEINEKKEEALKQLQHKRNEAQPLDGSADDIVNDVKEAIIKNSASLAAMLLNKTDAELINNAIMQILRPVFVNSFKRELSEYNEVISSVVVEFNIDVEKILSDSDNSVLKGAEEIVGNLVGKDIIENLLGKGLEKLAEKLVGYKGLSGLLKGMSKILGPLATIIVNIIPDLLRLIFGKSKDQKLADLQVKVCNEISIKIAEGMRPEIEKMLQEQREMADRQMEEIIEKEATKIDESIKESIRLKSQEKEQIENKIKDINEAATELSNLKNSL